MLFFLPPYSDVAASFAKRSAELREFTTRLHAAPACLRHCKEEEKCNGYLYLNLFLSLSKRKYSFDNQSDTSLVLTN